MAVRTAYAPVAGTAITAANHAKFPGGWIGYAEVTSNQTGISSQTDLTNLTVTVTAGTTRRILAEGYCRILQNSSSGVGEVLILEGGSQVTKSSFTRSAADVGMHHPRVVRTPSAGSNTYKLAASVGAGTIDIVAAATQPAFILVQDIGPSS